MRSARDPSDDPSDGIHENSAGALVRGLQRQEPWAVEALLRCYRPLLLERARRLRVPAGERQSLVLSFLDDIALRLGRATTPRSLDAYIMHAFRNAVFLGRRRAAAQHLLAAAHSESVGEVHVVRETLSEYAISTALGADADDHRQVLAAFVAHLRSCMSEEEQALLEWRASRVPAAQIAAWLGVSVDTLRVRTFRLRTRLERAAVAHCATLGPADRATLEQFLRRVDDKPVAVSPTQPRAGAAEPIRRGK